MNGYLEYVAKLNALPVKEKFGENRRYGFLTKNTIWKGTLYFLFVLVQILLKRIFEYFENFFAIGKYTVFICLSRFECNAL